MTDSRNSKDIGDETEVRIIHDLVSNGYSVSIPFGDNDPYDLVVEDDSGGLHRIQCKTGWKTGEETFRFNTHSQTTKSGEYHEREYGNGVDAFIVRHPPKESLYWVDVEDTCSRKMVLRFDADIDHPAINWAEEYAFDGEIPA